MDNVEPSQTTEVIQSGEDTQDEQLDNIFEHCDIISNIHQILILIKNIMK